MCQKRLFLISTVLLLTLVGNTWTQGQNLVPNPSFEDYSQLPDSFNQIARADFWRQVGTGSSDYFHADSPGSSVGVPSNFVGHQNARTGSAYAGTIWVAALADYREYIETPLQTTLVAGLRYEVSFYVSLSDNSLYAIDNIGAYLSNGSLTSAGSDPLPFTPQVTNPIGNFIDDKIGWTQIRGTYTATGNETHLIIGNFDDDGSTNIQSLHFGSAYIAYYYIDDVRVGPAPTTKWYQPPVTADVYLGWDEESHNFLPRMVADDFLCDSNGPVSAIRWWGSFINWKDSNVPDSNDLPDRFYLTIWDDVPTDPCTPNPYSHPGDIVWENYCDTYGMRFYGWEYDPRSETIELAKFEFNQDLDPNDYWYQPNDSNIYWLGIMAIYDGNEPNNLWGWETRRHYFQDDAVRFFGYPDANQSYDTNDFEPIEFGGDSWDMSFKIISIPNEPAPQGTDLGDAPDSSNNFSATMTTYTGVNANFPTVYDDGAGTGPYGPIHLRPKAVAHLGTAVTLEGEADSGWDQDPNNNIDPNINAADQDLADDGVSIPVNLPRCRWSTFDYTVNVFDPNIDLYVNVWFDWNRDGDWNDIVYCWRLSESDRLVPEWAVQNQLLTNLSLGLNTITTPMFKCWRRAWQLIWMRITLSEMPWVSGDGGSGPVGGYQYGETEDYYFTPTRIWYGQPDITANGTVDFNDFAVFAGGWLETDPNLGF